MRTTGMIIFIVIVLSIYSLVNYYILRRGWQALAGTGKWRWIFLALALLLVLTFPVARFAERILSEGAAGILTVIGGFALAAWLYAFFYVLIVDILRLVIRLLPGLQRAVASAPRKAGHLAFLAVLLAVTLTVLGGYLNSLRLRVRTVEVKVEKMTSGASPLNIVMASDIHLGRIMSIARLEKIVGTINGLNPDIVVLPGDTVDMDIPVEKEEDMVAVLKKLRAPLGVYAVTGNHEYYGGVEKNIGYLVRSGVRVLQDESVNVGPDIALVGRKDLTAARMDGGRKPLVELLEGVERSRFLLLLDHQPFRLQEAEENGIDLQLSGHTHAGQLIPLNFINKKIYEQYWGYHRKGKTQYFISCGTGTWGMPVRTGSVSEVVQVKVAFRE